MESDIVARLRSNARFFGLVKLGSRATIEPEFCAETAEWFNDAADEIERLRAERDEARRSCCEYAAIVDGADNTEGMESGRFYEIAIKYMKSRGWDCFGEVK